MRIPLITTAALLIAANALLHGAWTGRWHNNAEVVEQFATRLGGLPTTIGDWTGTEVEVDPRSVEKAGLAGHLSRRYVRPGGGEASIFLVCGRPGPISVHTPEVCYGGAGYQFLEPPQQVAPTGAAGAFWAGRLGKTTSSVPVGLQIYWSWNAGDGWQAPSNPRLAFARAPALYKVYVVGALPAPDAASGGDPAADFLKQLLPELERLLGSPS